VTRDEERKLVTVTDSPRRCLRIISATYSIQNPWQSKYVTVGIEHSLLLVKMKEKKLLKIQPLPKKLRVQAINGTLEKFDTGQNHRRICSKYNRYQSCAR
jgi:hypothetical protein